MERRKFTREFKLEAVRLIRDRGVSYAQASADLNVHPTQLRNWVNKFTDDPQHAFPGNGQMKPEQLEIARLKREVIKLKAERDILKNLRGTLPPVGEETADPLFLSREGAAVGFLVASDPDSSGRPDSLKSVSSKPGAS